MILMKSSASETNGNEKGAILQKLQQNPLVNSIYRVLGQIDEYKARAKAFYFEVLLSAHPCPKCHEKLFMTGISTCQCSVCNNTLDPTIAFQKSTCCSAELTRKTFHYACSRCNRIIPSRFTFNEKLFDKAYFREMMQESRIRAKKKREAMRKLLAASKSGILTIEEDLDLDSVPGFFHDLNGFVQQTEDQAQYDFNIENNFSMDDYRNHILSVLTWNSMPFSNIAPLIDDYRRDRVRRFITLIFMQNDREVDLSQDAQDIKVQKVYNEAYN